MGLALRIDVVIVNHCERVAVVVAAAEAGWELAGTFRIDVATVSQSPDDYVPFEGVRHELGRQDARHQFLFTSGTVQM